MRVSIGKQARDIINKHHGIGTSKKESRENSGIISLESGHKVSDRIHSYGSMKKAYNELRNLGKYAKEFHNIKNLNEITIQIIKEWIDSKNIISKTASNYLSNLNKTYESMNYTREEIQELRAELHKKLPKGKLTSRNYKHLEKIQMPPRSQPAFELQRDYGLRESAATDINIAKQLHGNILTYQEKGVNWSEKEINPALVAKIRENAVDGKCKINNRTYERDLKKEIEKSKQKYNGTHGIRHTYAQEQLEAGATKQEVSESMGHVRERITDTYLR